MWCPGYYYYFLSIVKLSYEISSAPAIESRGRDSLGVPRDRPSRCESAGEALLNQFHQHFCETRRFAFENSPLRGTAW